ncbi:MAG: ABC transporter ATP-binding protein [Alphaproteobacteria bacterium]
MPMSDTDLAPPPSLEPSTSDLAQTSTDDMAMVRVDDLVFDYPGNRALNDINFRIMPGTITALIGPNGAGKTTLMRCITALETPMSGRVTVDNIDVHETPRLAHQRMGYLSDFFGLYDQLTVYQCLAYRAASKGLVGEEANRRILKAAERMEIENRFEQKAGELSRGLRQRLAIAECILHEPKLVLLDEPASGLDPEARHRLSTVLTNLREEGMTLIVSSHILSELEDYSTNILILRGGRIVDHHAIGEVTVGDKVAVKIQLVEPMNNMPAIIEGLSHQSQIVRSEDRSLEITLPREPRIHAEVLQQLISQGVPVCGFQVAQIGLKESYLATVFGKGEAADRFEEGA